MHSTTTNHLTRIRAQLTYANVVASIALALTLGGVSYAAAALPRNSVGPVQLRANTVTTAKVKNSSLTLLDLTPATRRALHGQNGADGAPGAPGTVGQTGARGPSDVLATTNSSPSTGTLVAGSYLVFGTATSTTPGATCTLTVGAQIDTSYTAQGGEISLFVASTSNTPASVNLTCTAAGGYSSKVYAIQTAQINTL